jgi:aminomethyltransferase
MVGETTVGVVTSGNFSPVLEHGIALAFLDPAIAVGTEVSIDVKGSLLGGAVAPTPFVGKR